MPPLPAAGVVEGGLGHWRPLQSSAAAPAAFGLKQLRGLAGDGLGHHGSDPLPGQLHCRLQQSQRKLASPGCTAHLNLDMLLAW